LIRHNKIFVFNILSIKISVKCKNLVFLHLGFRFFNQISYILIYYFIIKPVVPIKSFKITFCYVCSIFLYLYFWFWIWKTLKSIYFRGLLQGLRDLQFCQINCRRPCNTFTEKFIDFIFISLLLKMSRYYNWLRIRYFFKLRFRVSFLFLSFFFQFPFFFYNTFLLWSFWLWLC